MPVLYFSLASARLGSGMIAAPRKMAREGFFSCLACGVHDHDLALQYRRLEQRRRRTQLRRRSARLHPSKSVRCGRELAVVGRLDDQAVGGGEPTPNIGDLGNDGGATVEYLQARHPL